MIEDVLKGIGLGLAGLFGVLAVYAFKRWREQIAKARAFDMEVAEKEASEKIDNIDPDSLIDELGKWMGPQGKK